MKFINSIGMNMKKTVFCLMVSMLMFSVGHSQTITINQSLFTAGIYRDSSNITVPFDINAAGTNGFGYNVKTNSVDTNYFILVIIPIANAATPIVDTSDAKINLLGGTKIGRYTFDINKLKNVPQVPYTTFVNGMIPKNFLGAGINTANYVLKVISVKPFVSSDATALITINRTTAPKIKSFAIAGSIGNTTAINYDPSHSAMFFGFCGPITTKAGAQLDSSISLVDSTAGEFNNLNQTTVYDSVILINNSFHSLINTDSVVFRSTVTPKGNILFSSGILKAGEYYTLLIKAKDDSGYVSSKSYFILNTGWAFNINRTTSASNGCKGDTVSLYPVINNLQAGQQFGIYDNFPGLLYNVTWGDPKIPGAFYYSFTQLIYNGGIISHVYDTTSCFRPSGSQYWPITAALNTTFQGSNCAYPVANTSIQIFSPTKAKFSHPKPICAWNALDTAGVTIKDSSYSGSNTACTGSAYYKWYRSFIGCGTANDTTANPFIYVDSSAILQNGVYVPVAVPHYDYKDIYPQAGKYIIKLFADNKQCKTDAYIDSIMVEAQPHAKFLFDSLTFTVPSISGCSPLNVAVTNMSDSTCSQQWNFTWDVIDNVTQNVIPPGTVYTIQAPSTNTSTAPVFVFKQQGTYKVRLIGSNACTKQDTAYGIVNVIGNGGVAFPSSNAGVDVNGVKINAFCIYPVSKTVNFDTAVKIPAFDAVLKPIYGGTQSAVTPFTWTITDIQGTHTPVAPTTLSSAFPKVTFTTPVNQDGIYLVKVDYNSTCGKSADSFFLYLNRQVYPKITNPAKDSFTICANTSSLEFDGTVTAADGSNSGYSSVIWTDVTGVNQIFGTGLTAFLTNVSTKTISFKAIKTQPNGCPDTVVTRKIGVTPYATGRDTAFSVCSGTKLNYNLDFTSKSGNTYIWSSQLISGSASGYNNCFTAGCGHFITDSLVGVGSQAQIIYTVTPTGPNGCAGSPFYVTVNILPYPIITLTASSDTICSGAKSHIFINSSVTGALYAWSYSAPGLQQTGVHTPFTNNIPTNQGGSYLDVIFNNSGNTVAGYTVYASLSIANSCSSPVDSITMYVIPGPTQPRANTPKDSIYLCNQSVVNLNATVPSLPKGEIGTWSQTIAPFAVFAPSDVNNPTAAPIIAPGNVYSLVWSISSPLSVSFGCPSLSDSVIVFNRPSITIANAGKDTTLCKYAGNLTSIPLHGNIDLTRPWEVGTWTCAAPNKFQSTGTTTATNPNDIFVFSGPSGEYDLVWTITNDAGCTATFDTLKIGAGFGNNFILKDTAICNGGTFNGLTGSLPTGGGGNYTYQWYGPGAVFGATSQNYTPAAPSVTTQYWRTTFSKDCPTANLKSNVVTVTVHPLPQAGLITTLDTSCAPFKLDSTILSLDVNKFPIDTTSGYAWYVNGVLQASGPKFSVNGLYTIANQGDSAIVELRDSSKYGCGNTVSIKHTFYTRIKPNPGFTASILSSCNTTSITFTDTTHNPGLYQGWHWDFGEGDVANTYNPPAPGSYTYNSIKGYDTLYFVKLTAWTACIHDSVTVLDTIRILAKPRASFYASKYSGCAPLRDSLFNTTIGQIDSATWYWFYPQNPSDFTALAVNPKAPIVHTFPFTAGVMLKVYNQCGVDSTPVQTIQVAFTAINLKLGLTYSDQYACAPHTSNQLYNAVGANVVDMWTYQLGNLPNATPDATTPIPAGIIPFTFANPGTYVIKVRASNFCDTVVLYDTVKTFLTPFPQFKLVKDTVCVGDTVRPVNLTNTPNVSTYWCFAYSTCIGGPSTTLPNPKTSTVVNPFVVFTNPGRDSIALATTISYSNPSPGYCSDTTKVAYTVVTTQKATMTVSNNNPSCIPATVTFTNNSPSSPTPPTVWNFDYHINTLPIATATGTNNPSYTYQDTGSYTVVLNTMSTGGCLYTDTEKIVVTSPYAQVWKYDHGYICGSTPVRFQVMNPSGVDSIFVWHFGDNTSTTTTWNNPTVFHSYSYCGNFYPTVDMISKGGCKYSLNWNTGDTIKIDSVKAGFTYATPTKNCGNTNICYTDISTACSGFNANSWSWNFGDIGLPANFSNLQNPCHAYHTTDTDTIQLQVTANSGCTSTISIPIYIKVNSIPQITTHVINPYNGVVACTGQTVSYSGTATSIDPIKDYVWTFGANGQTVNGPKTVNTYPATGTYLDTLTVNTIFGCTAQFFGSVQVLQTPTIAIAQTNPPQICRGVPYPLSATTTDPGTTIFLWGPAGGVNTPNANIVCTSPNCSNVTVSPLSSTQIYVQGLASNGCTGYGDTNRVDVIQPVTLTVTPVRDTICIGDSVQLNSVAVGATTYAWDVDSSLHFNGHFNDSVPNPIAHPVHIGDNIYTLRVTNGCFRDSAQIHILVGGYPVISLGAKGYDTITVQTGSTLPMYHYVHLSNDTFKTFVWIPSSGLNCNNCPDPVVTVAGNQLYTLKATTIYGCSDTDYMYIKTFCQNSQVFIPNAFTPDGDGRNDVLMVRGSGIKTVKNFRIYNRWGQVVFERANFNVNDPQFGWDGKIRNTNNFSPPDVYVYYCEVVCDDDIPFTYQGNITLIK